MPEASQTAAFLSDTNGLTIRYWILFHSLFLLPFLAHLSHENGLTVSCVTQVEGEEDKAAASADRPVLGDRAPWPMRSRRARTEAVAMPELDHAPHCTDKQGAPANSVDPMSLCLTMRSRRARTGAQEPALTGVCCAVSQLNKSNSGIFYPCTAEASLMIPLVIGCYGAALAASLYLPDTC
eukprot:1154291-Pelagomonas_calceolata.AAC.12